MGPTQNNPRVVARAIAAALVFTLAASSPARADDRYALPASARPAANWISWGTVLAAIAVDTVASARSSDRGRAFKRQALALGSTIGSHELLKRAVGELRPNGADRFSFPSEHTGLACTSAGNVPAA